MNHYTLAEMTPGPDRGIYRDRHAGDDGRIPHHHGGRLPHHVDADYARGRGFPGRVVYGMLGASFFSTLAGVYLPASTACSTAWSANLPSRFSSATR